MDGGKTVKLAERRIFSQSFKPLYNEGMGLVEQAAEYLDGKGRAEAKKLSRLAATLYAAESMRLTTRLMQVASWLLLQRAANSGEMTRDQVASEKTKVRLDTASAHDDAAGWSELPGGVPRPRQPLAQPAGARAPDGRGDLWRCAGSASPQPVAQAQPGLGPDHASEDRLRPRLTVLAATGQLAVPLRRPTFCS